MKDINVRDRRKQTTQNRDHIIFKRECRSTMLFKKVY